jgi:hypothetical protein
MAQLNKNDLVACQDSLNTIINTLGNKRVELFQEGLITQENFDNLGKLERRLIEIKDDIALAIIEKTIVQANATREKIDQATAVINKRINTLDDINEALGILSDVIQLFGGILGGISTGTIPDLQGLLTPFLSR